MGVVPPAPGQHDGDTVAARHGRLWRAARFCSGVAPPASSSPSPCRPPSPVPPTPLPCRCLRTCGRRPRRRDAHRHRGRFPPGQAARRRRARGNGRDRSSGELRPARAHRRADPDPVAQDRAPHRGPRGADHRNEPSDQVLGPDTADGRIARHGGTGGCGIGAAVLGRVGPDRSVHGHRVAPDHGARAQPPVPVALRTVRRSRP